MKAGKPFAFAGLWETWKSPEDELVQSATIITTSPNPLIAPIHNRMPAIVEPRAYERWLDPAEQSPEQLAELTALLKPYPANEMEAWPISTEVNNVRNDSPDLIRPATPAARTLFG
jgi:putative SOS response-associated peptidase YedK